MVWYMQCREVYFCIIIFTLRVSNSSFLKLFNVPQINMKRLLPLRHVNNWLVDPSIKMVVKHYSVNPDTFNLSAIGL